MHIMLANKLGALGAMIEARTKRALEDRSTSAAAVLSMLHFKPELTTTELASIVGVSQPTAVRLIDGLERQGLVERVNREGRTRRLSLTDAGHMEVARLHRERLSSLSGLLAVLSPDEVSQFERMLDRVLAGATTSRTCAQTTCRLCEHVLCAPGICPIGNRASEIEHGGNAA